MVNELQEESSSLCDDSIHVVIDYEVGILIEKYTPIASPYVKKRRPFAGIPSLFMRIRSTKESVATDANRLQTEEFYIHMLHPLSTASTQ